MAIPTEARVGISSTVFGANPRMAGNAYEDWNGNGTRDANDTGIANRTIYLDTNANGTFQSGQHTVTNTTPVNILDEGTITSSLPVSGVTGVIADVNVRVNITHTFDSDLDVFLVAPDGTRVELFTDVGGGGANFTNTILDDEASAAFTSGSAPFTGSFRPEGSLAVLDGMAANGSWTLEVTDDAGADVGTLNQWSLTVTSTDAEPSTTTDAAGNFGFLGLADGTYIVRTVVPSGWTATGPAGGSYSVTFSNPTDFFSDRDFGAARNNRFYGYVWDDRNANGAVDSGEPPVAGRLEFLDVNGNGALDSATNSFSSSVPVAIGDLSTVTSAILISGQSQPISDVNVQLNITHTYDSDLDVFLIAPDGTRVELFTDVGGSGAELHEHGVRR